MVERPDNENAPDSGDDPSQGDGAPGETPIDPLDPVEVDPDSVFDSARPDEPTLADLPIVNPEDRAGPDDPTLLDYPIPRTPDASDPSSVVEMDDAAPDAPTLADVPHPGLITGTDAPAVVDFDAGAPDAQTLADVSIPRGPDDRTPAGVVEFDDATGEGPTIADAPIQVEFEKVDPDGPTLSDQPIEVGFESVDPDGPTLADGPRDGAAIVFDDSSPDDPTAADAPVDAGGSNKPSVPLSERFSEAVVFDDSTAVDPTVADQPITVTFDDANAEDPTEADAPLEGGGQKKTPDPFSGAVVFDDSAPDDPTVSTQPVVVTFDDATTDDPTEADASVEMGGGEGVASDDQTIADGPDVDDADRVAPEETTRAEGKVTAGTVRVPPDQPTIAARPGEEAADAPVERPLPKAIGGYTITRLLGTGGMSVVYAALQKQPRRPVALKIMKGDAASARRALHRFKREVEILGRLNHPCIAQVYDAGTHDDGAGAMPFFVMEYVPGARTILQYAAEKNLSLVDRLKLFVKVCAAIEHGHRNKIVHRDLKPSNLLIDPAGQPKIIDFGVARAMEMKVDANTMQTEAGRLVGTIQYMSPEQVSTTQVDLDTRSDVYALGVLLYKLLTGKHPYNLEGLPVFTAVQMIGEVIPPRPTEVKPDLPPDLETILLKALEKDRARRYRSAGSLGRDLVRFLAHKPINARRASIAYRTGLLLKRHRTLVIASTVVVAVVLVSVGAWLGTFEVLQRGADQRNADMQEEIDREREGRLAAEAAIEATQDQRVAISHREHQGAIVALAFDPAGASVASAGEDRLAMLFELDGESIRFVSDNHDAAPTLLAFSADGTRLASAASDGAIVVLDTATGRLVEKLYLDCTNVRCLALSPDGSRVAYGCDDLTLRVHGLDEDQDLVVRSSTGAFGVTRFSADGSQIIAGSEGGAAYRIDASSGSVINSINALQRPVKAVGFAGDSLEVIVADDAGNVAIVRDGVEIDRFTLCPGRAHAIALDDAGGFIACATRDRLTIRNVVDGGERMIRFEDDVVVRALAIDAAGTWAAVGDGSGRVRLLPVAAP